MKPTRFALKAPLTQENLSVSEISGHFIPPRPSFSLVCMKFDKEKEGFFVAFFQFLFYNVG